MHLQREASPLMGEVDVFSVPSALWRLRYGRLMQSPFEQMHNLQEGNLPRDVHPVDTLGLTNEYLPPVASSLE